jgi:hypothetical protein
LNTGKCSLLPPRIMTPSLQGLPCKTAQHVVTIIEQGTS